MSYFSSFIGRIFAKNRSRAIQDAEQELLEVLGESRNLLKVASVQAERIISEANVLSGSLKMDIEGRVSAATVKVEEQLGAFANQIIEQAGKAQNEVVSNVKKASEEQSQQLQVHTVAAIKEYQAELATHMKDSQRAAQADLKKFVDQERKRITAQLMQKLPVVVREVVGQSISLREHERLVEDALMEIAKEIRSSYEE